MEQQDYITNVAYTANYFGHQAPVWLNYVAALNGYSPRPLHDTFDYCELGCGNGMTLVMLAAANPKGRFVGIDINPEHIRNARALAELGKVQNVRFLECGFADALERDLPACDFITLHGVYGWVGDEVRRQIVELLSKKLKTGGIAMVSYNALPGWAAFTPMRQMMLDYTAPLAVDPIEKARKGVAYLRFLRDNRASYFEENPRAGKTLDALLKQDLRYIVHEYFNPHWNAYYFSSVAKDMAGAGLVFAGNLPCEENYGEIAIPKEFQQFFSDAPSREVLETHKDFVRNTLFRNDIYVAQRTVKDASSAKPELFSQMRFGLMVPTEAVRYKGQFGLLHYELPQGVYARLFELLAQKPSTLSQLQTSLRGSTPQDLVRALQQLVLTGQVSPQVSADAKDFPNRVLNQELLKKSFAVPGDLVVLVSRTAGAGVNIGKAQAMLTWAEREVGEAGAPTWVQEKLTSLGVSLAAPGGQKNQPADTMKSVEILAKIQSEMTTSYRSLLKKLLVDL